MKHELIFNGKALSDFGVYVDGSELFAVPSKVVDTVSIPGRSGDLILPGNRWENVAVSVPCVIRKNFRGNFAALVAFLNSVEGYARLESTELPDVYRMAHFASAIEPKTGQFNRFGQFVLNFDAKPQKFLKSGEYPISISGTVTITNPTEFTAKPLLKVTGTGLITIGSNALRLNTNTGTTVIDCDLQDAYEGTINRNPDLDYATGDFLTIEPGTTTITLSSGMSGTLTPRWWTL